MLSRTYALDGAAPPAALEKDPDNTLYWRTTPRRFELEPIRDTLLFVSGALETEAPQPGHTSGMNSRGNGRIRSELDLYSPYRTTYLPILRDLLLDEYATFDFPDPSSANGLRHVTTAPTQALFFMNSGFVETAAARNANRLLESEMPVADRTSLAYRLVLGRDPSSEEIDEAEDLVSSIDTSSDSTTNGSPTAMRGETSVSLTPRVSSPRASSPNDLLNVVFIAFDFATIAPAPPQGRE